MNREAHDLARTIADNTADSWEARIRMCRDAKRLARLVLACGPAPDGDCSEDAIGGEPEDDGQPSTAEIVVIAAGVEAEVHGRTE